MSNRATNITHSFLIVVAACLSMLLTIGFLEYLQFVFDSPSSELIFSAYFLKIMSLLSAIVVSLLLFTFFEKHAKSGFLLILEVLLSAIIAAFVAPACASFSPIVFFLCIMICPEFFLSGKSVEKIGSKNVVMYLFVLAIVLSLSIVLLLEIGLFNKNANSDTIMAWVILTSIIVLPVYCVLLVRQKPISISYKLAEHKHIKSLRVASVIFKLAGAFFCIVFVVCAVVFFL